MVYNMINIFSEVTFLNEFNSYKKELDYDGFWLKIPRSHARMETEKVPFKLKDIENDPCYEFYLFRQLGTYCSRRDTIVLYKLPSGRLISIILYRDGGVDWNKDERKYVLRETDELDRRIILGFCRKYQDTMFEITRKEIEEYKFCTSRFWLQEEALFYTYKMSPKRFKKGSLGNDYTDFYEPMMEPYDRV